MSSGIFIIIIGVIALIVIFIARRKRRFKVAPFAVAAGLLLAAGLIQLSMAMSMASTTADLGILESESASSISSTNALTNAGKLDIDGQTYTADYDVDNEASIDFTGHEGEKLTITDSSDQNHTVSERFDAESKKTYWFTAESEPAVLHFRVENDTSYQTAIVTIEPDPDADAKESSNSASSAEAERNKYNTDITFDQLARNPDDYDGEFLHLTGKVLQVIEGDDVNDLRVGIDGDYDHVVWVTYDPDIMSSRVLEDDKITFYGKSLGTQTYESTLGAEITIPAVVADKIEDSGPAPDDYGY